MKPNKKEMQNYLKYKTYVINITVQENNLPQSQVKWNKRY